MRMQQLSMFETKDAFDYCDLESESNKEVFTMMAECIENAFAELSQYSITEFDSTTRSNMLNNLVVSKIQNHCLSERFTFVRSESKAIRHRAILDNKYILFFKKYPICNVSTNQDDSIKNQELDKHVIFVGYRVDDFWTSIQDVKLLFYSGKQLTYSFDLTSYIASQQTLLMVATTNPEELPTVKVKTEKIRKKKIG